MDAAVPAYYVVSRHLPAEHTCAVIRALSITPVACAVISDVLDTPIAAQLSDEVISTDRDALALAARLFTDMQARVVVVGDAECLDAIYPDGRREAVAISC